MTDNSPAQLVLDPKHPGFHDAEYIKRRQHFFDISRDCRLNKKELSFIEYTAEENAVWAHIYQKLELLQQQHAWSEYLKGKAALQLDSNHMPQLVELDKRIAATYGIRLVPAEGLLDTRDFHGLLSNGIMPCTQFIRHHAHPEYTPEPDAVHDVLGHLPPLMNKEYGEITRLIGKGVRGSQDDALWQWDKIYWFTIEYGLIEEQGEIKAFGAGLLSSYSELMHCFTDAVEKRPLSISEIVRTDYDPTQMQPILYVMPSLAELNKQLTDWISKLGLK